MIRSFCAAMVLGFLALSCEPPPVAPTADPLQHSASSRIEGDVFIQGPGRGNAVLFLFDAQNPPPPAGTGTPLSFDVIPAQRLYGASLENSSALGPFSAPFTFSLVQPGSYIIQGFLDHDDCTLNPVPGCRRADFNPFIGVTSQPNLGDIGGGVVDPVTHDPQVLTLAPDSAGHLSALIGAPASFSPELATFPSDRPAFTVGAATSVVPTDGGVLSLLLSAAAINQGAVDERYAQAFLVQYVDDNHDGVPDLVGGVPQLWPKIFVRKLDDADPNHLTDENNKTYRHAGGGGTPDGGPSAVILEAGIFPTPAILGALGTADGGFRRNPDGTFAAVPLPAVPVVVAPLALDVADPRAPAPLAAVPAGSYAVVVESFTGQTWRVPNELEPSVASGLGLSPLDSQGFFVTAP